PLIFPVSVDGAYGRHALEAMRMIRERYGQNVRVTGGLSNVSFGLPGRRLLNDVFLRLAMDAGADSRIVDPLLASPAGARSLDLEADGYALARDALLGIDEDCRRYLKAYRAGGLARFGASPPLKRAS